jgi:6-phosphofructokinase 1
LQAVHKHIGVITSGGDAPGMNSAVRGVVRTALAHDAAVTGYYRGYEGILTGDSVPLTSRSVGGIINQGGTILRSARSKEFRSEAGRSRAAAILRRAGVEGLVVIGGDGSLSGAKILEDETGIPCVGVPGSIDNDVAGTDFSIGFDTAVNTAVEGIDKLRDTAYSHERIFVVEVMGRRNGFIAVEAALAGGAEAVLIPEVPYDLAQICEQLRQGAERGKKSCIIIVAEGVGRASDIGSFIEKATGHDVRCLVLGHMQRGGAPTAFDRALALRMGAYAAERLITGHSGEMVAIQGGEMVSVPIDVAITGERQIDPARLALVSRMAQ